MEKFKEMGPKQEYIRCEYSQTIPSFGIRFWKYNISGKPYISTFFLYIGGEIYTTGCLKSFAFENIDLKSIQI